MENLPRIYLDHAATSWPKPEAVYAAMDHYSRYLGAPAGRGGYVESQQVERIIANCRRKLAQLIATPDSHRICFTQNGTDSLNQALHGWLKTGDHVVTTVTEHNSVLRPLQFLAKERGVTSTFVRCDRWGYVDPAEIRQAIQPRTRLVVVNHGSNVTGAIQPIAEVGKLVRAAGLFYLVDAAQTLGSIPLNVVESHIDLLAAPGHKSLLGPLGTGLLYVGPRVEAELLPLRQGGTGTKSDEDQQPWALPERLESGNLNVPGIVGLEAGVSSVLETIERNLAAEAGLLAQLWTGLENIPEVTLYGPPLGSGPRLGVVSLNLAGYDPQELAALLDSAYRLQTRAGIQCAPRMHAALGTLPLGTLRLSLGSTTTSNEIATTIRALQEIAGA